MLQVLLKRDYQVCLLHPAQIHAFAQQRGLRANRISSMLSRLRERCSAEKRASATYPVSSGHLSRTDAVTAATRADDVVRYKNEIHALLVVLFSEFTQVFVDPTRPTAPFGPQALSKCTGHRADRGGDAQQVLT